MIETTGNDLVVIASDPKEMVEGQHATIERMRQKAHDAEVERQQAQETLDAVIGAGLKADAAKSLVRKAEHRVQFLAKVREALEAGYVIVPNFPGETIAVRVKRARPRAQSGESTWSEAEAAQRVEDERPDTLPAGEGRYVNPSQIVMRDQFKEDVPGKPGESRTRYLSWPVEFQEEIGLPVDFLRPTVIERTGKVMARKIFDEVAISRNTFTTARGGRSQGKGDPMVIGRLIDRSRGNRVLSFLVAWFVDTSAI